ncbi:MAG: hypothetical protein ABIE03_06270 [Patescibacteria group bacterium]|nr:hypothetical protein [Patescibacteria group bacterium]
MEGITTEQLAVIMKDEGVVFVPKRELRIPPDNQERLVRLVNDLGTAKEYLDNLRCFLLSPAIDDQFGSDHTARCEWRFEMRQQYGDLFWEMYYVRENQFRAGSWGIIGLSIEFLAQDAARKNHYHLSSHLMNILTAARALRVDEDAPTNQKMVTIHALEDICLEVLKIYSAPIVIPEDIIGKDLLELSDDQIKLHLTEPTLMDTGIGHIFAQKLLAVQTWRAYTDIFAEELAGPHIFEV